ncbi:MAG: hypothetical protein AUJ49_04185 [Desulfovibrionaceae bacterium CG1_02_65_16]|nr:MAG: hypothetical protein AUJ49_04185 [Desulfovibrionaceae bacterium CG1_02_65_16]
MRRIAALTARLLAFATPFLLYACASGFGLGPAKLPLARIDYNMAIEQSNNEEMLLNLVRMKYFEQPLFLQVGSVASSFSYNLSGGLSATLPEHHSVTNGAYNIYTPTFSGQYSDSPTVTYTAYQGQAYAQQFLADMDFDRFITLYKAGWDIGYLMPILFARFGTIDHTYDAHRGFMPEHHARFLKLTSIIKHIDNRGDLDILKVGLNDNATATIMRMDFVDEDEAQTVQHLIGYNLDIQHGKDGRRHATFKLVPANMLRNVGREADGLPIVPLRLRNCLRAIDYVAQAILIPKEHAAAGRAVDLRSQFSGLCAINASRERPADAYVAVRHEDIWYAISNDDTRSKEVFQLLMNIFSLQSADPPKTMPVLTLPVGGS